ncbi:hypothetical protein DYB30_002411 [Aphanomyces astaci]|uniref:FH2 domain-containing protein n=1 Tax=Aphanomyces astaci TaxID=112090 RepID=A0A397DXV9_APHAT|nr:hypothetical protein DYB30_002411 [Aphanomyces astaci]
MAPTPTTDGVGKDDMKKKPKSISHKLSRAFGLKSRKAKSNNAAPAEPATSTMPANEGEIERLFSEAVDNMALPKAATDRMRTLPLSQKWQIIQDWTAKQNSKGRSSEHTQPLFWVHKLQDAVSEDATTLTHEDARQLHVLMRGCDKEVLHRIHGMQLLLHEPDAIEVLVLCLDFEAPEDRRAITIMTLEMLSLMCWFSETGHSAVLQAMEKYRRANHERCRYWSVVECLKVGDSLELQAACLTFINTLVSTCAALDDRVDVRNDFLAMDMLVLCHAIEEQYDALELEHSATTYGAWGQGDAEKAAAKSFSKQVEVFEGLMHSDMQDTIVHDVDLANVDAVVDKLKQRAHGHGWSDRLLHALLALLVIPGEISIGEKMWEMAEEALIQITSCPTYKYDKLSTKRVTFAAVKSALQQAEDSAHTKAQNLRLEAQVAQLTGKLAELQAQPMSAEQEAKLAKLDDSHVMALQLQAALSKILALETQVATLQQDAVSGGGEVKATARLTSPDKPSETSRDPRLEKYAKLLKMGMPRDQVAMKMKVEGMDIADLDINAVGGSSAASAPDVIGMDDPKYQKFTKLLKMGMPLEQVQLKAKAEGVDLSKLTLPTMPACGSAMSPTLDPKYDKFVKLLKMGMPKDQVKLKAQAEGLDPSVLDNSPVVNTSSTPAIPPSAPLSVAAIGGKSTAKAPVASTPPAPVASKLPPKKATVPTTKLRGYVSLVRMVWTHISYYGQRLYWNALPDMAVEGSIWAKMDENKLGLDLTGALDKDFSQDGTSQRTDSAMPVAAVVNKPKLVHLVDPKRQQNCSIALSRFRMTPSELKQAILTLDDAVLTLERLVLRPLQQYNTNSSSYEGDATLLGETEKFFLAVLDIPRLAQRLRAVHTTHIHLSREDDVRAKVKVLEKAVGELTTSHHTVAVLEVVLAVGNYLNGGTPRGGVWGFKLDILPKLAQVKSTSSTSKSLLHVIADLVAAKAPHANGFYDALPSMEAAAAISLTQLQTDLRGIEAAVTVVQQEAYKQAVADNDQRRKDALKADAIKQQHRRSAEPEDGDLFNQFSESLEGDAREIVAKFRKRHQGGAGKQPQVPSKSAVLQSELSLKLARRRESSNLRHKK